MLSRSKQVYLLLFEYNRNNQMNFEDKDNDNLATPSAKGKIRGVIVLTDNRLNKSSDKTSSIDFRCSAYKETEVDPLEFTTGGPHYLHDDDLLAELTRRVTLLETRVEALSKNEGQSYSGEGGERKSLKKKNRRRFKQLVRDNVCPNCQKVYGSETALKYHLKLKHNSVSNHSQAQ